MLPPDDYGRHSKTSREMNADSRTRQRRPVAPTACTTRDAVGGCALSRCARRPTPRRIPAGAAGYHLSWLHEFCRASSAKPVSKSRSRGQNLNINPDRAPRRCSRSLPPAPRGRPLSPAFAFLTPSQGFVATRGMSGERRSRRGGGSAPPTDEEDEIQKLQAERLAAAAAGPSQQSGGEKYAGYARELADEEPEEDEPVRYVWRVCRVNPITALVAIGRPCPAIVVAKLVRRRETFRVFDSSDTPRSRAPPARPLHTVASPPPFSPPPCFAR